MNGAYNYSESEEDVTGLPEWQLSSAFCELRHTEAIRGITFPEQKWRMKERVSS